MADRQPWIGCTHIMWRGRITGNVVTCGVCEWCKAQRSEAEAGDTDGPSYEAQRFVPEPWPGGDVDP